MDFFGFIIIFSVFDRSECVFVVEFLFYTHTFISSLLSYTTSLSVRSIIVHYFSFFNLIYTAGPGTNKWQLIVFPGVSRCGGDVLHVFSHSIKPVVSPEKLCEGCWMSSGDVPGTEMCFRTRSNRWPTWVAWWDECVKLRKRLERAGSVIVQGAREKCFGLRVPVRRRAAAWEGGQHQHKGQYSSQVGPR